MSTRLDRDPAGGISACQVFVPCLPLYKVSLGCTVVFSCPCAPESAARRAGVKNSLGVWQGARWALTALSFRVIQKGWRGVGRSWVCLGTGGSPGAAIWAWAQEELMEMEKMFHWWERGLQGGSWGHLHFSALGTISGDRIYLHSHNALQRCTVLQVRKTGCHGALISSGRDNALNTDISTYVVWNTRPIFLLSGWLC